VKYIRIYVYEYAERMFARNLPHRDRVNVCVSLSYAHVVCMCTNLCVFACVHAYKRARERERERECGPLHRTSTSSFIEHIELPAKLLDYFLRSNKSNINQKGGSK